MKEPREHNKQPDGAREETEAASAPLPKERRKAILKETLAVVQKLGRGASGLVARLRKSESLQDMREALSEHAGANEAERGRVGQRMEQLHRDIAAKKGEFGSAAAARRRVLELELKNLLSQYQAAERTYGILLENERTLHLVLARLQELNAYSLSGIDDDKLERLGDALEDKSLEAEMRADAVADLEKAGTRRESGMDGDDLWEELAAFDTEEDGGSREAAGEDPPDAESPRSRERQKPPLREGGEPSAEPEL